jgi:hypothetical protein
MNQDNNHQAKAWRGLTVELIHNEVRATHLDTEGNPAYVLGTIVPSQHSTHIANIYKKYWGMLNSWSYYYPVKLPIPLATIAKNQGITVKGVLGDLWDWVEHPMPRRYASTWAVRDEELAHPREGNPNNLRKPDEMGYWTGHLPTTVIKSAKVRQENKLSITIPEGCIDMYREMTNGFFIAPKTGAGRKPIRFIQEAINVLHYWRVPICVPTVGMMVAYSNKLKTLPGHAVISKTMDLMGLEHTDTISSTCTWLYNFPMGSEPSIPEDMKRRYPHQRKGWFTSSH